MLFRVDDIQILFNTIQKKALKGGVTVVIFVSYEIDSLCAAHILTGLLKDEGIQYRIVPVSGFGDLNEKIDELEGQESIRSIILLNSGGGIDLTQKWFATNPQDVRAYVLDYHRPIHHRNILSSKQIIVVDDGYCQFEYVPNESILEGEGDTSEEEAEEEKNEDEGEILFEEEEEENDENQMQMERDPNVENEDASNQDQIDEDLHKMAKKRKRKQQLMKLEKKRLKQNEYKKQKQYYSGSYYGKSVAGLIYALAQQLNKENLDYLWFWILGLTDQFIHNKINYESYREFAYECQCEVLRLSPSAQDTRVFQEIQFEDRKSIELETVNRPTGTIIIERDLRFMLLRNWSLYESMYNSEYVSSKMKLWKESGKKELNQLIARMGVPLDQAKQEYRFMDNSIRTTLKDRTMEAVNKFHQSLSEILIPSFLRQLERKVQISATDMVYGLSAILETPKVLTVPGPTPETISVNKEEEKIQMQEPESMDYNKISNFWYAYDAIQGNKLKLIEEGIKLAKDMQKTTIQEAISIIERRNIQTCREFRFSVLGDHSINQVFFQHPKTLQKLASLLISYCKEIKPERATGETIADKPLMIGALNKKKNTYLVVGVIGTPGLLGIEQKNKFGTKFLSAAKKASIRARHDNFETSIIEIHKDDFEAFIEEIIEAQ